MWNLSGCIPGENKRKNDPADKTTYRTLFDNYIKKGNEEYAKKEGYGSFHKSLVYFDSAQAMAEKHQDTIMIIDAIFARGRVYDAWNKEPEKTVYYFKTAADLLQRQETRYYPRYMYLRQLVAHAYEKMGDTANALDELRQIYIELSQLKPTDRDSLNFIPEMALIATQIGVWPLADSVLKNLTNRALIRNDPDTYNYLDHYYLSCNRLDIFWKGKQYSPYTDSVIAVYQRIPNLLEKIDYTEELYRIYAAVGDFKNALQYMNINKKLSDSLNDKGKLNDLQQALISSEIKAGHRQLEYESQLSEGRALALWMLSLLLAVITILAIYLYRQNKKYKRQSLRLNELNDTLDAKVRQVELLNKEIQHRVKNNLNMIYSLLHMQERQTSNEEVIANLQTARMRVESISVLHNQLQTGTEKTNLNGFIKQLVTTLIGGFPTAKQVTTDLSIDKVSLPAQSLLAVSLILNEWITNAIKHSMTDENGILKINIRIYKTDREICIEFKDNGTRYPTNAASGLGTQIVNLLCKQLSATLSLSNEQPYHYKLSLPDEQQNTNQHP